MSILYGTIVGIVVFATFFWFFRSDQSDQAPFSPSSPPHPVAGEQESSSLDAASNSFYRRFSGKKNAPGTGHIRFLMAQAGHSEISAALEFIGRMNFSTALGAAVGAFLTTAFQFHLGLIVLSGLIGAFIGRAIPRHRLQAIIEERRRLIARQLPEVVDFLTAEVESGASFDDACHKLMEQMSGPLPEHIKKIYQMVSLGLPRWEAFVNLTDVIGNPDFRSLVDDLVAIEFKGELLGKTLRRQADKMRGIRPPPTREEIEQANHKLASRVYLRLIDDMPAPIMDEQNLERKRGMLRDLTTQVCYEEEENLRFTLPASDRDTLVRRLLDDMLGFGPLQALLDDADITRIMVNGPFAIFHEKRGRLEVSPVRFLDNADVMRIIERMIRPFGKEVHPLSPSATTRLPDGSTVQIVIPPLCLNGPSLLIQKRATGQTVLESASPRSSSTGLAADSAISAAAFPTSLQKLIDLGTLSAETAGFLMTCVRERRNMIITGAAETGKSTLLNVLSSLIAPERRILVIDEKAELELHQPHVLRLTPVPGSPDGRGKIETRGVIAISRDLRPDYTLLGEFRSPEMVEALSCMNGGSSGVMTTCRISPTDADESPAAPLEALLRAGAPTEPPEAVRRRIAGAVQLVIRLVKASDGSRKITRITEIQGMQGEEIVLSDRFQAAIG